MSKRKDKKLRRLGIKPDPKENNSPKINPTQFFRNIGIKPEGTGKCEYSEYDRAILRRNDPELREAYEARQETLGEFFHKDLDRVKIYYGVEFPRIVTIAEELARLAIISSPKVLDIGGGPGHLAFWMAKIWNCPVVVADKYSNLGEQWAREIKEDRVKFVNAPLSNLAPLEGKQFDIVVLSRVLSYILGRELPTWPNTLSTQDYIESPEAKEIVDRIESLLEAVIKVLSPEGQVIVAESWSAIRVLLFAKAFQRRGLFVALDSFIPERVGMEFSVIVFSRSPAPSHINDPSLALATIEHFGDVGHVGGLGAESIRAFFGGVSPTMVLELTWKNQTGTVLYEVFERDGLVLWYTSSTGGMRAVMLCPSIEVPRIIKVIQQTGEELQETNQGKITRQFLAEKSSPK